MPAEQHYAEAVLDETWAVADAPTLLRGRRERGFSRSSVGPGFVIQATTDPAAPPAGLRERLVADEVLASLRDGILDRIVRRLSEPAIARVVLTHFIQDEEEALRSVVRISSAMDEQGAVIVTSSSRLDDDLGRMTTALDDRSVAVEMQSLPTLWVDGSGGVLLHEAIGHPAGIAEAVQWPGWLEVVDDPSSHPFESHRIGPCAETRELFHSPPAALRRASFRDHPLFRLSHLVARASAAPFDLPERFIEIRRASGGHWDPLTDRIRLDIAEATLVQSAERTPVRPFTLAAGRREVARSLRGARGASVRYPGLLCSELGQRLPTGASAPDLLLEVLP